MNIGKILGTIGRVGKGAATILGLTITAGGALAGGGGDVATCIEKLVTSPDTAAVVVGLATIIFGLARKAGWIARAQASSPQ